MARTESLEGLAKQVDLIRLRLFPGENLRDGWRELTTDGGVVVVELRVIRHPIEPSISGGVDGVRSRFGFGVMLDGRQSNMETPALVGFWWDTGGVICRTVALVDDGGREDGQYRGEMVEDIPRDLFELDAITYALCDKRQMEIKLQEAMDEATLVQLAEASKAGEQLVSLVEMAIAKETNNG